jgi:hypothetical protein
MSPRTFIAPIQYFGTLSRKSTDEASDDLLEYCDILVRSEPTTLAGVVSLLGYLGTLDEWQLPRGYPVSFEHRRPTGWVHDLCKTLENVVGRIEAIAQRGQS